MCFEWKEKEVGDVVKEARAPLEPATQEAYLAEILSLDRGNGQGCKRLLFSRLYGSTRSTSVVSDVFPESFKRR